MGPYDLPDLEQLSRDSKARLDRMTELQQKLIDLTGTGESADGMIQAVVSGGAALRELTLNPRVMRLPSETLAEQIIEAATLASQDLEHKVSEAVREAVDDAGLAIDINNPLESAQKQFDQIQRGMESSLDEIMANVERLGRQLRGRGGMAS